MQFEELYRIQEEFTEKFFREKYSLSPEDIKSNKDKKIYWNKDYILMLIKEATEMLDEIDFKNHVSKDTDDIEDNFLEEGIDVLKYLLGIFVINGFTADDIISKFQDKSKVVEAKFRQEKSINEIKAKKDPIAFIDIDGILATWPNNYIDFVNAKLNRHYKTLPELKAGVDKKLQYELKNEYRLNGSKKDLGVIEGAKGFLDRLKKDNFNIVLLTARPYKKYFRIYSDTLEWLNKHGLKYDCIIFDEEKEKYIINKFYKKNVKFIVEDQIDNAKKLSENGFKVYLRFNAKLYKDKTTIDDIKDTLKSTNITVIKSLREIFVCHYV